MALTILDGNQTAVTLATTVSGSAHYPNHIIASGTVTANVPNIQVCTQGSAVQSSAIQTALGVINTNNNSQVLAVFGSEVVDGEGTSAFVQIRNQISGTVTIGSIPNGALTTRFGSITTANTAFATTAVTNTSRKYLIIQNIASTVITVGIGFTPTTTQGIQLVAGATITYDGNYIPTGAVRILSSVTASNFTVLEA